MKPEIDPENKPFDKASMSKEECEAKFRELLAERGINSKSVWEKELSKIVFDSRYLLLSSDERKTVFANFVSERKVLERSEKRQKTKEAIAGFRKLLADSKLSARLLLILIILANSFQKKFVTPTRHNFLYIPHIFEYTPWRLFRN